ncbi:MAG: hypothetical protein ACRD4Q_04460 [Candidatus Acidiferrales bacterium]
MPYATFGDPQTLNLYSCVRDNPLGQADMDGHCTTVDCMALQQQKPVDEAQKQQADESSQAQQQPADHKLTNVVYNELGSGRADPKAKPDAPGSAEDLANGRQAVAEIANRVMDAGHPNRVAPSDLTDDAAVKTDAYAKSRTVADVRGAC